METVTQTVTLYAVSIALLLLGLGGLVIWSRRELRMRFLALGFSIATLPIAWTVFNDLPGRTRIVSTDEFKRSYWCTRVLHAEIRRNIGLYLLVRKEEHAAAEYIFIPWNMRLATSLQKGMRVLKHNKQGYIIFGGRTCAEQSEEGGGKAKKKGKTGKVKIPGSSGGEESESPDGDFLYRSDPVPPRPEKNYGPTYESPIELPSN